MTSTIVISDGTSAEVRPAPPRSMLRKALLACGVISSLLYIGTDIMGGLRYEGYSFISRAISELTAIGAPSAALLAPLYAIYSVLVLAFGAAVLREGDHSNPPLELTGILLISYAGLGIAIAIIGFAGSTTFSMHQRGTATMEADVPHILLTAVYVLFLLSMIACGAFALGKRFARYSFLTLAVIVVFVALTIPFAPRIQAGSATPGLGIIERVNVYAGVLWPGMLAIALLRQSGRGISKERQ